MTRFRRLLLVTAALTAFGLASASAGPDGPNVVGGVANVVNPGTAKVIVNQQTEKAIINWRLFDVGANEKVQFNQPNNGAIALNRVTGGLGPSQIFGTIDANGRVFLINRDGILFGPNSVINTAGFLATTHDIRNDDFMAGRFNFNIPGRPDASIVNLGTITATNGGFAALVAPGVRNTGTITATLGNVTLAAGNGFSLDFYGDKLVTLAVGDQIAATVKDVATGLPLRALVGNDGKIKADGGRVELTAVAARQVVDAVINTKGVIEANTVGTRNGMIVLGAATGATKPAGAPTQTVKVAGTLKAAGIRQPGPDKGSAGPAVNATGGTIVVTGENIQVTGAQIIATGDNGGGKVLIGGDWGGGNPDKTLVKNPGAVLETFAVPTATTVTVDAATRIDASATQNGNGGKVILWANDRLTFAGTILATGGIQFGTGGFVETSGKTVDISGTVKAPGGTWLLDPADVLVDATLAAAANLALNNGTNFTIATTTTGGGNGDIFVNSPIAWNTAATLTLTAFRNIQLNDLGPSNPNIRNFGGAAGNLVMRADSTGTGIGTIIMPNSTFPTRVDWTNSTGTVKVYYNPTVFGTQDNFTTPPAAGRIVLASFSQLTQYMLVNTPANLQAIGTNGTTLAQNYALGPANLDMTGFTFVPIGAVAGSFTGQFDGLGNTISNLTIAPNNTTLQSIGMFSVIGATGVVSNLNLANVHVTANPGFDSSINSQWVGALAGSNAGTINNVTVTGVVDGLNKVGVIAGGIVGQNGTLGPGGHPGTIMFSTANVAVTVGDGGPCPGQCNFNAAGGLVGANIGGSTISDSHATGNVTGTTNAFIGGLAGYNGFIIPANAVGTITNSYATGNVTMTGLVGAAGGLVGTNGPGSVITDSQALGAVNAPANQTVNNLFNFLMAGGLVGQNFGTIAGTATPPTTTTTCAAGAQWSCAGGTVNVGASAAAGGLVGQNNGIILFSFATGNVTGAPGLTNLKHDGNPTNLGGLVGMNSGLIAGSFARGNVGAPNVANLTVGGLVAENSGTIVASAAFGLVRAGDNSVAGGLVGNNSPFDNNCNCNIGDGFAFFNTSFIAGSTASGNVTVGSMSLAGGFVGGNDGFLFSNSALGNVTGGANTFLGGFVGVNGFQDGPGMIAFAAASGSVTSTGPNSVVGGFAGGNVGLIANASASGTVTGTSDSFLGGFAGINLGTIADSNSSGDVTAHGARNIMGGFVGLNVGLIDPSTSSGNVTGGTDSFIGGFVGANAHYTNFAPGILPGTTFPTGTISPDSHGTGNATGGAGSTVDPQVATNNPGTGVPAYPSPIQNCDATGCVILKTGTFGPSGPQQGDQNTAIISPQLVVAQQLTKEPDQAQPTDPVVNTTATTTTTTTPNSSQSGPRGGVPPSGRMPSWYGPDAILPSGMPALNETRFRNDEVVFQLGNGTAEQIAEVARKLGMEILAMEDVGLLGRKVYRLRLPSGLSVREAIKVLQANKFAAQVQPVYVFELVQAPAAPADNQGDSAQYIVSKLRLPEVHTIATGKDVLVAVVDSAIDVNHPDLAGVIAGKFDSAGGEEKPHPHGTGMAGAIASHKRLLGIAPGARLLAIQAFGVNPGGAQGTSLAIVKGLNWAVEQGAKVINMSFAGPPDPILAQAIKGLRDKGIVLIAAAGNAGPKSPKLFPGADPNVIAAGATDADDNVYKNSNRGYITVAAPGVDILVPAPDGGYQLTTGTSVAAAHISGVVALLLERSPNLKPDEVKRLLTSTATKLKARPEDVGAGLVDPLDALLKLRPKTATIH